MSYHRVVYTTATAPAISDCPSLVGPTVINRTQIEFYCDVITSATDSRSRFRVSFLFNFEVDRGVPDQILTLTNLRATLHERYLAGRLNKAVRCWTSSYMFSITKMHKLHCHNVISITTQQDKPNLTMCKQLN